MLDDVITEKKYAKNQLLFSEEDLDNSIFYVVSGVIRKYILKEEKEITLDLFFAEDVYFPQTTNYTEKTKTWLQAIEDTLVYQINILEFDRIKAQAQELKDMEMKVTEYAYLYAKQRLESFQTMNATQRYLCLLDKRPDVIKNVPLIYIAAYLGINNASLSKIRNSLNRK